MRNSFLLLGLLTISIASFAQPGKRPEILVLGSYHMANPGHDIYNMQADDVRSPKRQQEMAQLLEVLKKFRPTKIAVEADVSSLRVKQQYSDYVAGKYTLSRNEIDQIGYRLAKELGQSNVFAVDEQGDFPIEPVAIYAKARGVSDKYDAMMAAIGEQAKEQDAFLKSHTILETMEYLNSDPMITKGMGFYFAAARYGEPGDYAGPDLLAAWYQRNIRIYHNIVNLIDSPDERILVIYGAGHLGFLQQDIAADPAVRLRKLSEFATL